MMQLFKELGYAGVLRSIGQTLENLRIESFSVVPDEEGFIVRDKTRNRTQLTPREKAFLSELSTNQSTSTAKQDALRQANGVFEWHLTGADIERLETAGRERRRDRDQTSDSHSNSQILRMMGELIDQRRGQLISVSKSDDVVSVEFLSSSGQLIAENYTLPMIYNFWVRSYKKRAVQNEGAGEPRLIRPSFQST
jgi:membrane-bound lytic murein transglycosylase